jgi:PKD repeat protein
LPHSFYGTVTLMDAPAPAGAEITAIAPGVIYGTGNPFTIVTPGIYGGTGIDDKRLEVQGYIEQGAPIQFYISGSLAEVNDGSGWMVSYPYTPMATTELDLRANVTGPVANFVADPVIGTEVLTVVFTDRSTGPPASYYWEFGDGQTSTLQNPVHKYYNGRYTVNLTVTNVLGEDTLSRSQYITVYRQSSPGGGGGGGGGGYYAVSSGTTPTATPTATPTPTPTVTPGWVITGGTLPLNSDLALSQSVTIASQDNTGFIFMVAGMRPTTSLGEPLLSLTIRRLPESEIPLVPAGALFSSAGYAYEIEPGGAAFDPSITLAITVSEEDWAGLQNRQLFIKWYNPGTSAWEDIPSTVDPVARTVSAKITHTSVFALFASLPPTTAQTPVPTTAPVTPSGFDGILTYLWILIIAVIIVVAVMIVIFILKRRGEPEEEMTEEESWKME